MPDKWGRPTFKDGADIATQGMGLMNQMKRNDIYNAELQDRNLRMQDRAKLRADEEQVKNYTAEYSAMMKEGKELPIPSNKLQMDAQTLTVHGFAATEDGNAMLRTAQGAAVDRSYKKFRPYAVDAMAKVQSGDYAGARPLIEAASKEAPLPYQYKWDEGSGFYIEQFRSDKSGKWEDNRHVTEEEATQALSQIMQGEQVSDSGRIVNPYFYKQGFESREASRQGNFEARNDPKKWIPVKKGNETFYAIPQNSLADHKKATEYILMDEKGNITHNNPSEFNGKFSSTPKRQGQNLGLFSMEELNAKGLMPENLDREGKQAAIAHTKQTTATSKQNMIASKDAQVREDAKVKREVQSKRDESNQKEITGLENSIKFVASQIASKAQLSPLEKRMLGIKVDKMTDEDLGNAIQTVNKLLKGKEPEQRRLASNYLKLVDDWRKKRFSPNNSRQTFSGGLPAAKGSPQTAGGKRLRYNPTTGRVE
ncbi:hypothetical protein [Maridesulfovibrio ferrireducens]|uniref:hypothetical protein n=1 Tax=Maridesulfovibrio ferrireducens TaxID=246191 RepID=UPI001A1D392F|nr:hypothetical protein [Maridesulfovibrio ferrireducens]MBI9113149.1 hypothetical protein [Maridesulfovibrio ferrireducens]